MTEELLELHKAEILRLKDSFEKYKDMYDKLARRQKLWDEYLDLEVLTTATIAWYCLLIFVQHLYNICWYVYILVIMIRIWSCLLVNVASCFSFLVRDSI